ncbi:MAG: MFS transporter [Rectinemataceae bacterium]
MQLSPTAPSPELVHRRAILALIVVLLAAFMDLLDATIVSVAAPSIAANLRSSNAELQWTLAGYTLALGAGLITGGRIGDQFGRRRVFLLGLAGFILASIGCALAPSAGFLIAMRVAQGLAAGFMIPQVFGIIRTAFAPAARAMALGAYGAVLGLASVAGPLLGGVLVDANWFGLGWRAIFWVNVPLAAVGLLLGARVLPESHEQSPARLDLTGSALAAGVSICVLLPLVQGSEWGWPWWSLALMAAAVPIAGLFLWWERRMVTRGRQPILDPALLRVPAFVSGLAISLLFFGAIASFFLLLSLYLQLGTGRNALDAGLIILPYAVGSIITAGVGIQFATKAGRAVLIAGALTLAASQTVLLIAVGGGANPSYWALAVPLFIGGLGLGLTAPSLINLVLAAVPARDAGAVSGVLTTVGQIGNAAGVAVLGLVFFGTLKATSATAASPLAAYGTAFSSILFWQITCYAAAAALMLLLPRRTSDAAPRV